MSVRILSDRDNKMAALYCSTTEIAFGPLFNDSDELDADERAELFIKWLPQDARRYTDSELAGKFAEWLAQEHTQIAEEEVGCDD